MAHPAQLEFFSDITKRFERICRSQAKVLEVGSRNINGTVREYFPNAEEYIGVDIGRARDVDWVVPGELLQLPDAWADIVITTECLEHCDAWERVFLNMIRMLKPKGVFLMTCASIGRAAHGTLDSDEYSSPFTTSYYKNLGVDDISQAISLGEFFDKHSFEATKEGDLYFWGIRSEAALDESLTGWSSPLDRLARAQGQLAQAASVYAGVCKEREDLRKQLEEQIAASERIQQQLAILESKAEALEPEVHTLKNTLEEVKCKITAVKPLT